MGNQLKTVDSEWANWTCAEVMAEKYDDHGYDILPKEFRQDKISTQKAHVKAQDVIFVAVQTPHDPTYEVVNLLHLKNKDFDYTIVKKVLTRY
jgi:response regulator RpfG family c-di-GMP phosphodiesterase